MEQQLSSDLRTVLCIDDDEDDRELVGEAIRQIGHPFKITYASNGEKALELLNTAIATTVDLPCLVLLDINMPVMGGKETLIKIKLHEQLRQLPVVVFTTSINPADKQFFAKFEVPVYTKPDKFEMVVEKVKEFLGYCN